MQGGSSSQSRLCSGLAGPNCRADFCGECQAAVTSLLMAAVERRIKQALTSNGLPADSLQIANDKAVAGRAHTFSGFC